MQIIQMLNWINLSHASRQRTLHGTPQNRYLIDTKAHPRYRSNPRQARLGSSMGYWKALYMTKNLESLKTSGKGIKGSGRKVHSLLPVEASLDDEFRSYQNIAVGLLRRYQNVIERGCGENLREFVKAGVTAYAVGCTDEGLRKELISLKHSDKEIEGIPPSGSSTSLKPKITADEEDALFRELPCLEIEECVLWLSIIFITILCTPQPTVVRWSKTPSVSAEIKLQWKGFCALIANAYYSRGMAWLPVKTLQLEQMAVTGAAEEPAVVAGRMRLVFATLEVVSPQWPRV